MIDKVLFLALIAGMAIGVIINIILSVLGIQIGTKRTRAYINLCFWSAMGTVSTIIFAIYKNYFFLFLSLIIVLFILSGFLVRKKLIFACIELVFLVAAGITITLILALRYSWVFSLIFIPLCGFFIYISVIKIKSILKTDKEET